jgi:type II secretory pathway component PulK
VSSAGRRGERGVVLLLVLVILTLTIGSVYAFQIRTTVDVIAVHHRADRARAQMLARSGVELATRAIIDDATTSEDPYAASQETAEDAWRLVSRQPIELPGGGVVELAIQDAASKINLNGLIDEKGVPRPESAEFLKQALTFIIEEMPGRDEDKFYEPDEIAEAILDWIDADTQNRLGDDEKEVMSRANAPVQPLDRPLLTLAELDGVPGIDGALLETLDYYFTCFPLVPTLDQSGVNPNTAPPHVLALLYHGTEGDHRLIERDDLFRVLRGRREGKIFCEQADQERCVEIGPEIGSVGETVFPPLTYHSDVFEIASTARVNESRVRIVAVLDRSDPASPTLLSYRIE